GLPVYRFDRLRCPVEESHEARVSLNSSGLTPTAASTAVSAASGVWLRRVLLAVAALETLVSLIDLAVFVPDLNIINARLFIHPFFSIAALVLAARWYFCAAVVLVAGYNFSGLAIGEPQANMRTQWAASAKETDGPVVLNEWVCVRFDHQQQPGIHPSWYVFWRDDLPQVGRTNSRQFPLLAGACDPRARNHYRR